MSQAMHSLVCYTCRGTEFYEDRQGNFTCQRCGALSQDYFAESHEVEDAIHTRGMRTIKGKVMSWSIPVDVFLVYGALINTARRVLFAAQTATKTEVDVEPITAMECVSLYQECLRGLAQIVEKQIGSAQFVDTVRSIWFEYLSMWQQRGWSMQTWFSRAHHSGVYTSTESLDSARQRRPRRQRMKMCPPKSKMLFADTPGSSSESDNHLDSEEEKLSSGGPLAALAPTKPLLLGFLYLACAQLRSFVIPADLVRWCTSGLLPLANLWASDCIPPGYRERFDSVPLCKEKRIFSAYFRTKTSLPTVANIFFHAEALAKILSAPFPPLNAPLIARRIVSNLGLPPEVWRRYYDLTKLRGDTQIPLNLIDTYEQYYPDYIGAAIMIACKLCPTWAQWGLVRKECNTLDTASTLFGVQYMPVTAADLDTALCRRDLPTFLENISHITLPSGLANSRTSAKTSYNNLFINFFAERDENAAVIDSANTIASKAGTYNKNVWTSDRQAFKSCRRPSPAKYSRDNSKADESTCARDIIYPYPIRNTEDTIPDLQYTVLLERIARCVGCWPGDLHRIVNQLESLLCELQVAPIKPSDISDIAPLIASNSDENSIAHISVAAHNDDVAIIIDDDDEPLQRILEKRNRSQKRPRYH